MGKSHVGKFLVTGYCIFGEMLPDDETDERILQFSSKGLGVAADKGIAPAPKVGVLLSSCGSGSRSQIKGLIDDVPEQMGLLGQISRTFYAEGTQVAEVTIP